jgi:oligopeptide transport system ATP-binding protein
MGFMNLLQVQNLTVSYQGLQAVRDISFEIQKGQSIGIVGESGSGKSAAALAIMGLNRGSVRGNIRFQGNRMGMVFQDPMTALNPTMKIGAQITEGWLYHGLGSKSQAKDKAIELLRLVGVNDPEYKIDQYPHCLSGGQRQRVLIAIAIACNPDLLIADEPTTALDIEIRTQVLELLKEMRYRFGMSLLLVSHDFSVIASSCDQVLVMYAGKIIERGETKEVLKLPRHPYTQMLLDSLPSNHKKSEPLRGIDGSPPCLQVVPTGCAFKERCPYAAIKCLEEPVGDVACWRNR